MSLTVTPVNDPPVAAADTYGGDPGQVLVVAAGAGVLANDIDADETPLSAVLLSAPASGTLNLSSDGAFDYTPPAGFNGPVTFTYRASDGAATSAPATVTINVNGIPSAGNDAYTVDTRRRQGTPAHLDP